MLDFPVNIYVASLLGSGLSAALSLPLWRRWCLRHGLMDEPGGRKRHSHPVPLAGGLAVFSGLIMPVCLSWLGIQCGWLDPASLDKIRYGFGQRAGQLLALFTGAAAMLLLGWLDDKYELKPAVKFAGQCLVAAGVALAGIRITLFVDHLWFSYLVTILWIVTVVNAFNFLDNMNGLCAGVGAIAAGWFAFGAIVQGHYLVAALALSVAGSLLGFLPGNYPRATTFLGDSGSHLAGFLLAALAILPHFYSDAASNPWAVLTPLLVLALPLADLLWVVLFRTSQRLPFYQGDTNHFSHLLVRRGLSPALAVALLWLLSLAAGAVSLLL